MNYPKEREQEFIALIEEHWSAYRVTRKIGEGGFGAVYQLTKKNNIGNDRAVKLIYSDNDESLNRKITEEISLQDNFADIREIVTIHDSATVDLGGGQKLHLIMQDLMEGSVREMLNKSADPAHPAGRIDVKEAVQIMVGVCHALEEMKAEIGKCVVHGDIKPENILFQTARGKRIYKLSDFGCVYDVEQTRSSWAGTERYTIPGDWDPTRDEYAMGITLMEMLGAECPSVTEKIGRAPLWSKQPYKEIPSDIVDICRKAASRYVEDRYQNASEFKTDLKKWLDEVEKEEKIRKMRFARVDELFTQAKTESGAEVLKSIYKEVEELIRELLDGANEDETSSLGRMEEECKALYEKARQGETYERAAELAKQEDYHACIEAVRLYADIATYKDAAKRIRETADKIEQQADNAVKLADEAGGTAEKLRHEIDEYKNRIRENEKTIEALKKYEAIVLEQRRKEAERREAERRKAEEARIIEEKRKQEEARRQEAERRKEEERRKKMAATPPGAIIEFGHYPQTAGGKDSTPIKWRVLKNEGNRALVISEMGVDCKNYHGKIEGITWAECDLQKWLNKEFKSKAFSHEEIGKIQVVTNENKDNSEYGTKGGKATEDQVFLLSLEEAEKYFKDDASRMCKATEYAVKQGAYVNKGNNSKANGFSWWWLRSPGFNSLSAADVNAFGSLNASGRSVGSVSEVVRPALWLTI